MRGRWPQFLFKAHLVIFACAPVAAALKHERVVVDHIVSDATLRQVLVNQHGQRKIWPQNSSAALTSSTLRAVPQLNITSHLRAQPSHGPPLLTVTSRYEISSAVADLLSVTTNDACMMTALLCLGWAFSISHLGGLDAKPLEIGRSRLDVLDIFKFSGITLVIFGQFIHSLDEAPGEGWRWRSELSRFFAFTARGFCFISGILSRTWSWRSVDRLFVKTAAPAIIHCFVMTWAVFPVLEGMRPGSETSVHLIERFKRPTDPIWFLYALVVWRLLGFAMLPLKAWHRLLLAVIISSVAGYFPVRVFAIDTALLLFPVFVFGQTFPLLPALEHCAKLQPLSRMTIGVVGLLLMFITERSFGIFMHSLPLLHHDVYVQENLLETSLYWTRGLCCNLMELTKAVCFFFFVCPHDAPLLSWVGARTMYPYILYVPCLYWRKKKLAFVDPSSDTLQLLLWVASLLFCAAIAALLATPPVRCVFRPVVEPTWLRELGLTCVDPEKEHTLNRV